MLKFKIIQVPQTNFKQEIVTCFQAKFGENACILPIVEHRNRIFMNKAG